MKKVCQKSAPWPSGILDLLMQTEGILVTCLLWEIAIQIIITKKRYNTLWCVFLSMHRGKSNNSR